MCLDIEKYIQFKSNLTDAVLVTEYNQASIAVCPSLYEGFGLPAGEAMSCALPVVSSDGGALPEVVGDAGIVVKAGNSGALVIAIENLLKNPSYAHHLGLRGRKRILEKFCWNKVGNSLTQYYLKYICNHRCTP